ncbi:MAG: condensation domain-containing protein [Pyrinomonadaceae bacterium]
MNAIAKEIAELSPERRRLLRHLLKQETASSTASFRISRRESSNWVPLSFAQQRLWFLNQLEPTNPAYNTPAAVRLQGCLSVEVLERTLNEIVERHEVLRTTYKTVERRVVQVINAAEPLRLSLLDLSDLPEAQRVIEARLLAVAEAQRPFDLAHDSVLRASLLRLDQMDHVLLVTIHHIACDGWSMGVLVREVAALYEAFAACHQPALPELPIQYADFAVWEQQWLQGKALSRQLAYWKQRLGGNLPALDLPTDRPRPIVPTHHGSTQSFVLPVELSEALKALGQREGVTLFMLLLAAYQTLVYRYTGQEDILVGSPIANRNRAETEGLIGCFINTLVMRTDFSGNPGFRELLRRVREVVLGAFAHQDVPFEKLVEELRPERTLGGQRLFNIWFVLQNAPMQTLELSGLTLSNFKVERGMAQFDLAMSLTEVEGEIVGTLDYLTDLFNADTIAEMLERFTNLLREIVANPEARLLDISLNGGEAETLADIACALSGPDEMEDQFML